MVWRRLDSQICKATHLSCSCKQQQQQEGEIVAAGEGGFVVPDSLQHHKSALQHALQAGKWHQVIGRAYRGACYAHAEVKDYGSWPEASFAVHELQHD